MYRVALDELHRAEPDKVAKDWGRVPKMWGKASPIDVFNPDKTDSANPFSTSDAELEED